MRRLGSWTARDDKGRSGALVGRGGGRGGVERRGVWVSGDDHRRRVVAGHGGAGELGRSRKERRSAGRKEGAQEGLYVAAGGLGGGKHVQQCLLAGQHLNMYKYDTKRSGRRHAPLLPSEAPAGGGAARVEGSSNLNGAK